MLRDRCGVAATLLLMSCLVFVAYLAARFAGTAASSDECGSNRTALSACWIEYELYDDAGSSTKPSSKLARRRTRLSLTAKPRDGTRTEPSRTPPDGRTPVRTLAPATRSRFGCPQRRES